jgi:hypothetical protein
VLAVSVNPDGARCRVHSETPAVGICGRCGSFGCRVCLTRRGNERLCPDCLGRLGSLPWDERETLGLWRAWWRTSVLLIRSPIATLERARPEGSLGGSLLFALFSTLAGYGATVALVVLAVLPEMLLGLRYASAGNKATFGLVPAVFVFYAAFFMAVQLISILVVAGIDQLMLRILGAQPRGYQVSVRANALSLAPALVGLVPVCGVYAWPIWSLILRVIALRHLHKTTAGKAVLAVLLPMAVLCGLCGGAYALLFAVGLGQAFT